MKFQPREHRVSVETDDVSSLPNMYSRRTLLFSFRTKNCFAISTGVDSEWEREECAQGLAFDLNFAWLVYLYCEALHVCPPPPTPSVFLFALFCVVCFICQTGRKNPSSFLSPFAGVSAALPSAISAFISLRFLGLFFCSSLVFVFVFSCIHYLFY